MRKAGVELIVETTKHTTMGLTEVVGSIPFHLKLLGKTVREIESWKPDVIVPVDYPDFNLRLSVKAAKAGFRVVYYVSPQVWAWRRSRVRIIRKYISKMMVIFPFEVDFYKKTGVNAVFVGHPLVDRLAADPPDGNVGAKYDIPGNAKIVGVLPGSRNSVYERHWRIAWDAARLIGEKRPDAHFVTALSEGLDESLIAASKKDAPPRMSFHTGGGTDVIASSDVALLTSGTATVEAALLGTPMAVFYKVSSLSYNLARMLVKVPAIAMCNLIAEKMAVPEFIQRDATPEKLSRAVLEILEPAKTSDMRKDLALVTERLGGGGASENAARELLAQA